MTVGGPSIAIRHSLNMPKVGLGTWQSTAAEVKAAVKAAVHAGYRLIDTASCYQNEAAIGEAIKELINDKVVTREELFITTKAWVNELDPLKIDHCLNQSLKRLQLNHVDLYLAHMPTAFEDDMSMPKIDIPVESIWKGFDNIFNKGLAKAVGVSNWNNDQIRRALKTGLVPVHNSQVEMHLYFPQHEHIEFCKQNNISVTSYATLGSPGRVNFKLPNGAKLNWAPAPSEMEDPNVIALAKKYNKTPAQILLRYALDRGVAIIPKSINEGRIKENFNLFDFSLTAEEITLLQSTSHNQRLFLQDFMAGHKEDAFKDERTQ